MSTTVTVLIVYLGILAALAIWSRRETHTLSGFYLAGKKLPYWVVAFSTNATGESGWLLLGLSGMGYAVGDRLTGSSLVKWPVLHCHGGWCRASSRN